MGQATEETLKAVGVIVQRVAGDKATVTGIIGSGVDPHLYKASAGDVITLPYAHGLTDGSSRAGILRTNPAL